MFDGQLIFILFLVGNVFVIRIICNVLYVLMTASIRLYTNSYFLWDTIIAIYFYKYQGISMVLHGIVSFSVFIFSFVSKYI